MSKNKTSVVEWLSDQLDLSHHRDRDASIYINWHLYKMRREAKSPTPSR